MTAQPRPRGAIAAMLRQPRLWQAALLGSWRWRLRLTFAGGDPCPGFTKFLTASWTRAGR